MHQAFFMRVRYSTLLFNYLTFLSTLFIAQAFTLFKTISTAKIKRKIKQGMHTLARKTLNKST